MEEEIDPTAAAPDQFELHELQNAMAWDVEGKKLGAVSQVAVDDAGRPAWVSVPLGLLETHKRFVPVAGARLAPGPYVPDLHLTYSTKAIKDAPHVKPGGTLSPADQELLRQHYGI